MTGTSVARNQNQPTVMYGRVGTARIAITDMPASSANAPARAHHGGSTSATRCSGVSQAGHSIMPRYCV